MCLSERFKEFLNNYFDNEKDKPTCREERQYALFLFNKLLDLVKKHNSGINYEDAEKSFLDKLGLNKEAKIISVYYEVPFMRDFIYKEINTKEHLKKQDDESFNIKLCKFIKTKIEDKQLNWLKDESKIESLKEKDDENKYKYILRDYKLNENNPFNIQNFGKENIDKTVNYGSSVKGKIIHNDEEISDKEEWHYSVRTLMRAMMNSKADIGILYLKEEEYHLKFIECKYESDESDVRLLPLKKDDFIEQPFVLRQTVIQYFITEFICNEICNKNINGKKFIADYPSIVIFSKEYSKIETKDFPIYYYSLTNEEGENAITTSSIDISDLVPKCLKKPIF